MGALTPAFMFDLESNMRQITSNEFERLKEETWWQQVAKRMDSQSKKERLTWLLDTAQIRRPNNATGGGQAVFEDLVGLSTEYENENAHAGLRLKKEQLEDLDGNGVQLATHWSRGIAAKAVYWPQQVISDAIKANPVTYDGVAFFHGSHPVNPYDVGAGTYANLFTGSASGAYPGALPISGNTVEVAFANLAKAVAYMGALKMPDGKTPRKLRIKGLLVPPALMARAVQLCSAETLVQSAASGALTGDVRGVLKYMAMGLPIMAEELGAAFGGSDTSYYFIVEDITSNELGAFTYVERESFNVIYHGPMTDAELAKHRFFEWLLEGRNVVGAGHPYLLFRADAT